MKVLFPSALRGGDEILKCKFILLPALILFFSFNAFTQSAYFQQEVNYSIDVVLDDSAHFLDGTIEMEYINHSPDVLDSIYIHLWANGYQSRNTAFAEQQLNRGNTDFYFAQDKDLGGYSGLDFKINGKKASWAFDGHHRDIAIIKLEQALKSGESIIISTPFRLKIPAVFSRLGHADQSYNITQWYPKPAVYDQKGWHPMPYLDLGEFYSEFGNFDVKITLAEDYVVGATGILQTQSEIEFLKKKEKESTLQLSSSRPIAKKISLIPPSIKKKTIRFTAKNVHDFAWFADKRFLVQQKTHTLLSGKQVQLQVLFHEGIDLWKEALDYTERATAFYSEMVGEYPYPKVSVVQGALMAGGGMEYPMITVIDGAFNAQSLDEVITHEIGHNWFYGILGFNERDYGWMDEGINSYYELEYMDRYYPEGSYYGLPAFLFKNSGMSLYEAGYLYQARQRNDLAPQSDVLIQNDINFWLCNYGKPSLGLKLLEKYLGTAEFNRIMRLFYAEWKFKHPQPEDMEQHFEKEAGEKLDWFFNGLINSDAKVDYVISSVEKEGETYLLTIKNKGDLAPPFKLSGFKDEALIHTSEWHLGFKGTKEIYFDGHDFDLIVLDEEHFLPDLNRKNNRIRTTGYLKKVELPNIRLLTGLENAKRTDLFAFPVLGWNAYDKFMPGLILHNKGIPHKNFEFSLMPLYAMGSNSLTGMADASYKVYLNSGLYHYIDFGISFRSFHYSHIPREDWNLRYNRFVPSIKFQFRSPPLSSFSHYLKWRSIFYHQDRARYSPGTNEFWVELDQSSIHEISYVARNKRAINPFSLKAALELHQYYSVFDDIESYLKASLEWQTAFTYHTGRNINLRFFGGGFIHNTKRKGGAIFPGAFHLLSGGHNDYRYDDLYFGRNEEEGLWSQQVSIRDGGFKNVIDSGHQLGRSNSFIIAINAKVDLPFNLPLKLPVKPYFDIGYFDNAMPAGSNATFNDQFLWSGGFMLDFFDETIGIYVPVISSDNLSNRMKERGNFWTRVSFSWDFHRMNPFEFRNLF